MDYPLISPEKPGEFDGADEELVALIRQSRIEKVERHQLERDRAKVEAEPESEGRSALLKKIDDRISALRASRIILLHEIARRTSGYRWALFFGAAIYPEFDILGCTARVSHRERPDLGPDAVTYTFTRPNGKRLFIVVNPLMWEEAANFGAVLLAHECEK